jgi:hypothetical protein
MKSALTKKMKEHLITTPGPGTTCMTGMNVGYVEFLFNSLYC